MWGVVPGQIGLRPEAGGRAGVVGPGVNAGGCCEVGRGLNRMVVRYGALLRSLADKVPGRWLSAGGRTGR